MQEVEARIQLFSQQQDISMKIEAQAVSLGRDGEGSQFSRMTTQDDVEAYLESFERTAAACKWDLSSWVVRIGPLLIDPVQAAYWAVT